MIAGIAAGDPDATRTVYGVVIGLAVVGVALLVVAIWLFRQTKVDPELLAPLERMDDRRWASRDPATQRRMLDDVRPEGAEPLHRERPVPALDAEFEAEVHPVGFDDLKDVEVVLEGVELAEPASDPEASAEGADEVSAPASESEESAEGDEVAEVAAGEEADGAATAEDDPEPAADGAPDAGSEGDRGDAAPESDDEVASEPDGGIGAEDGGETDSGVGSDVEDEPASESDDGETNGPDDEDADAVDVAAGGDDHDDRRSAVGSAQD